MAKFHVPDLAAIERLSSLDIKFYAIIGAVVSLTSALEITLLDVLVKGLNVPRDQASQILYKAKAGSLQRDIAEAAMTYRLGSGPLVPEWKTLRDRIIKITGQGGLRHLIAHNVVSEIVFSAGLLLGIGGLQTSYVVEQDQQKILAGVQKPQTANFESLKKLCQDIIALLGDLERFLEKIP